MFPLIKADTDKPLMPFVVLSLIMIAVPVILVMLGMDTRILAFSVFYGFGFIITLILIVITRILKRN